MSRLSRGFTLHEMLISLTVMAGVVGLVAHVAAKEMRFVSEATSLARQRAQLREGGAIVASLLWSVSPRAGDLVVALDSAVEFQRALGTTILCASAPGRITVPAAVPSTGPFPVALTDAPRAGDRVFALFDDSLGSTWLGAHVAEEPSATGACMLSVGESARWTIRTAGTFEPPLGSPVRFSRAMRLSLYRGGDGAWYLGGKDWNAASGQFNAVQPLAGPFAPYTADPSRSGLSFTYRDSSGEVLPDPVEGARVASVIAKFRSVRDSVTVVVALRNR